MNRLAMHARLTRLALLCALAVPIGATEAGTTLEVLSFRTQTPHGAEIARAFSRLLYLNELEPRVSITVLEGGSPNRTRSIRLQTPVRAVSRHEFRPTRARALLEPADAIAEAMLRDALEAGLLRQL